MSEVNVRKRGKKWEYRIELAKIDGKRTQKSKGGFDKRKDALDAGTKALAEYNNSGIFFEPSEISVSDYLDYWLEQYCKVNLLKNTCNNYEKKIRLHIKPEIGNYKLKSLSSAVLQELINKKFNEGYSRNSLSVLKGILVNSLNYATTTLEFIKYNPALSIKLPLARAIPDTPTRLKERIILSDSFIEALFTRFNEQSTAYIELLLGYTCGLRLGEAFAIDIEKDIDLENGYLQINHQVQFLNGYWTLVAPKYNSTRKIKLDSFTIKKLERYIAKHYKSIDYYDNFYKQLKVNDSGQLNYETGTPIHLLSTHDNGTFIQPRIMQHVGRVIHYELYKEYPDIDKDNFVKYDFHSLRHKHTTMLLEAGANPKDVQVRLGHKNIETTLQVYSHVTEKMQNDTKDILDTINVLTKMPTK